MKHIFYLCRNAEDSLGLEKILSFYNIISMEKSDATEDLSYSGVNICVTKELSSKSLEEFVLNLSYGQKPYILSSYQAATIQLSELYDWDIHGRVEGNNDMEYTRDVIRFSVYKKNNALIFGNIHTLIIRDTPKFVIEILDYTHDYISIVIDGLNNIQNLQEGFNTVESIVEQGKLKITNVYSESLPQGINIYTQAQILDSQSPFVLYEIFDSVENEQDINFHEDFKKQNPKNQDKSYDVTLINIKTKYETYIKNDMPSGIWKYGGDNTGKIDKTYIARFPLDEDEDKTLCLMHRGYSLYDIVDKEGIVINTRESGTKLAAGDKFASIVVPGKAVDTSDNVLGWVNETINGIVQYTM